MDNELDCLTRMKQLAFPWGTEEAANSAFDIKDVEDKQWYIECKTLELKEIELNTEFLATKAHLSEKQIKEKEINKSVKIKTVCSCGSKFEYEGFCESVAQEFYIQFLIIHKVH